MRHLFSRGKSGVFGRIRPYSGLIFALVIGLVLRLVNLGAEPYWGDEILSLDIATRASSYRELVRYLAEVEFHPPLYYLILRPWASLFGTVEAATRALSVIASLGTIAVAWVGGKVLFRSAYVGTVAALLIAVLPAQVEYGQEARPYALLAFAAALAVVALWKGVQERNIRALAVYVVAMLVAVYLHYSAFFIVFATASWWILDAFARPAKERAASVLRWSIAHGAMFLAFFPWLQAMFAKMLLSTYVIYGVLPTGTPVRPAGFVGEILERIVYLTGEDGYPMLELAVHALVAVLILAVAAYALRRLPHDAFRRADGEARASCYLAWLIFVPVITFAVSPLSVPYAPLWVRHVLFVTFPIALGIGFLASKLPKRPRLAFVAVFLVSLLVSLANVVGNDGLWNHYHKIGEVGTYISTHHTSGDLVIIAYGAGRVGLTHYLPDDLPVGTLLPLPDYGNDLWRSRHRMGLLENEGQLRSASDIGGPGSPVYIEVQRKIQRLVDRHDAQRVWLYSFSGKDASVHDWFSEREWRHAFSAIEGIFALDLYVPPVTDTP